jgi:hypothetical protein
VAVEREEPEAVVDDDGVAVEAEVAVKATTPLLAASTGYCLVTERS